MEEERPASALTLTLPPPWTKMRGRYTDQEEKKDKLIKHSEREKRDVEKEK